MAYQNKPMLKILNQMEQEFGKYYYLREDAHLHRVRSVSSLSSKINRFKSKKELLGRGVTQVKDFDGVKLICEDESWLMLRASGTEPLLRVYAEAKSLVRSKQLLNFGKDFIGI